MQYVASGKSILRKWKLKVGSRQKTIYYHLQKPHAQKKPTKLCK